jgi:hypothetical protein
MSNPYNYHLPVRDDAMFFGRARLLSDLSRRLTQSPPISAAVFGGRRFGKTSLLRKLQRDMQGQNLSAGSRRLIPWYYDPQAGYPIECDDDFFLLILEGVRHALCEETVPRDLVEDTYGTALHGGAVHAFEECFRLLVDEAGEQIRLVMLVDEAEALVTAPWATELRPHLRNLLSNSGIVDSIALVMAGSTQFHKKVVEKDSPLVNILSRFHLSNLSHQQTLDLSRRPNGNQLPPEAAEEVWIQTGGHPCLTQFVMHELWYDLPEVAVQDVQDVASTFTDHLDHFEYWSDALSPLAHDVYRMLVGQDSALSYRGIRQAFSGVLGRDLQDALSTLAYHGVIQVTGSGRGRRYAVAGQMFHEWYLGDQPTLTVVSDLAREAQPLTHETFDLEIETRGASRYEIQVLYAPAGPVRSAEVTFDPTAADVQALLQRVQIGDGDAALLTEVGTRLHAFMFPERIWAAYVTSREAARRDDRGLSIKLRIHQPELAALPWELLYDPTEERFLALSGQTPLIRFLPGVLGAPLPPAAPPWRLLLVTASPENLPRLEVNRERDMILEAVDPLVQAGQLQVAHLEHATLAALLKAIRAGAHWLHFIGHGEYNRATDQGALFLEEEDGTGVRVGVDALRHLLPEAYAQADARLRMVFLNACATAQVGITPGTRGLAQTLVQAGIPTAIGMGRPIANLSARAFSAGFYSALAEQGWPFHLAVTEGRRRVMVESGLHGGDWAVPVLFSGA